MENFEMSFMLQDVVWPKVKDQAILQVKQDGATVHNTIQVIGSVGLRNTLGHQEVLIPLPWVHKRFALLNLLLLKSLN